MSLRIYKSMDLYCDTVPYALVNEQTLQTESVLFYFPSEAIVVTYLIARQAIG